MKKKKKDLFSSLFNFIKEDEEIVEQEVKINLSDEDKMRESLDHLLEKVKELDPLSIPVNAPTSFSTGEVSSVLGLDQKIGKSFLDEKLNVLLEEKSRLIIENKALRKKCIELDRKNADLINKIIYLEKGKIAL